MATNAQWVFEKAMHLMDEVNESTGETDTADTREYPMERQSTGIYRLSSLTLRRENTPVAGSVRA